MAIPTLRRKRTSKKTVEQTPLPAVAARGNGEYKVGTPPPHAAGGCSRKGKVFMVPFNDNQEARAIRAHEYAHLAVDTVLPEIDTVFNECSEPWAQVILDNVVNGYARARGVSVSALPLSKPIKSGDVPPEHEKRTRAQMLLQARSCKPLAKDAKLGTKESRMIYEAAKNLQYAGNKLSAYEDHCESKQIFKDVLARITSTAKMLESYFGVVELPTREKRIDLESLENRITLPPRGRAETNAGWSEMKIVTANLDRNVQRSRIAPVRRAGFMGTFRSPIRTLLPAFDGAAWERRVRREGGTILLDMSGSMLLFPNDVVKLLRTAPFATIAGYSEDHDSNGTLQILAANGQYASHWQCYGGGNGVDGPALQWMSQFKGPKVWISDMEVYGRGGCCHPQLAIDCRNLCIKHEIMVFPTIDAYLSAAARVK